MHTLSKVFPPNSFSSFWHSILKSSMYILFWRGDCRWYWIKSGNCLYNTWMRQQRFVTHVWRQSRLRSSTASWHSPSSLIYWPSVKMECIQVKGSTLFPPSSPGFCFASFGRLGQVWTSLGATPSMFGCGTKIQGLLVFSPKGSYPLCLILPLRCVLSFVFANVISCWSIE